MLITTYQSPKLIQAITILAVKEAKVQDQHSVLATFPKVCLFVCAVSPAGEGYPCVQVMARWRSVSDAGQTALSMTWLARLDASLPSVCPRRFRNLSRATFFDDASILPS
jgi:hypothetical protein